MAFGTKTYHFESELGTLGSAVPISLPDCDDFKVIKKLGWRHREPSKSGL
jgi:hypothetical protein